MTLTPSAASVNAVTQPLPRQLHKLPSPRKMIEAERFADNAITSAFLSVPQEQPETHPAAENDNTGLDPLAPTPAAATGGVSVDPQTPRRSPDTGLVLAHIRDSIAREHYPQVARRYGWEGKVQLGFRIAGSGAIDGIHVMHSSGHRILDESAIHALQSIGFVPAELWLDGYSAEMQLPVIYRLNES